MPNSLAGKERESGAGSKESHLPFATSLDATWMWFHSFWQALYLGIRFESHVRLLQSSIHRTFFEDFL